MPRRCWFCFPLMIGALLAGCRADGPKPQPSRAAAAIHQPAQRRPEKYAVLINGDSERRHKRNILDACRTLLALGFDPARIVVFTPQDARVRLPQGTLRLLPVPDRFWNAMDQLSGKVAPRDLVLIYGTGHGDTERDESLLELRRGELWAGDLREEIGRFRGDTVLVMDQCYSGGFSDALEGTRSRVLAIASVDHGHVTDCYYFARAFWDAFLHPERADRNHDGKTSVREAFAVALAAHQKALAGDPEIGFNGSCRSFNGLEDVLLN